MSYLPRRTHPETPTILDSRAPSVMLNRLQSGIGALTFDVTWPDATDIRMGCAFQQRSRQTVLIGRSDGIGPIMLETRGSRHRLLLNLLTGRHLDRLIVFATPSATDVSRWNGTLFITTYGGARMEVPLDSPVPAGATVLLSAYNLSGEYVLRSEAEHVPGSLRDACLAYGFDRITWRDPNTPA